MMNRTFHIILLIFTIQFAFAQETTQKSYHLYGKNLGEDIVVQKESKIDNTSNGILSIEYLDQKVDGELTHFSVEYATRTYFKKNSLEKTFLKDRTKFIANAMGETMNSIDSSSMEGKTFPFSIGKNNIWTVPKLTSYNEYEQAELEEIVRSLNDTVIKTETYFKYPKKMYIGERFVFNEEKINSFYEIEDIKKANGTLVLKEVVTRGTDTVGIFDLTIEVRGLIDPTDKAYMTIEMNGTIERSLTNSYDREMNLSGTIKVEGNLDENQHLTMVVPATLVTKQDVE